MIDKCIAASKKVNMMFGLISKKFDHKSLDVMKTWFNSGHQTILTTKIYCKEYREERQNTFLHCVSYEND